MDDAIIVATPKQGETHDGVDPTSRTPLGVQPPGFPQGIRRRGSGNGAARARGGRPGPDINCRDRRRAGNLAQRERHGTQGESRAADHAARRAALPVGLDRRQAGFAGRQQRRDQVGVQHGPAGAAGRRLGDYQRHVQRCALRCGHLGAAGDRPRARVDLRQHRQRDAQL